MKKIFRITLAAVLFLSCISCSKEENIIYRSSLNIININVPEDSWGYSVSAEEELDPKIKYQGNWFKATIEMPEITKEVFNGALVKMYRVFDQDGTQMEMPFTRQFEDYDPVTGCSNFYTESIDYEFMVGRINIFYTRSDFVYEDDTCFVPGNMKFRFVISQ